MQPSPPRVKTLVLDAGPLLSLTPLRGLAERYLTPPQVLGELKDKRAREHFETLALTAGVRVEVRNPDSVALAKVVACAKKTGDYAVLSHADLCVLALTCAVDEEEKQRPEAQTPHEALESSQSKPIEKPDDAASTEDVIDSLKSTHISEPDGTSSTSANATSGAADPVPSSSDSETDSEPTPLFDDPPSDEDDGEGEWITPANVALHKSRALELLPSDSGASRKQKTPQTLLVGCMTADFAMQNVLLQMNLNLVSVDGRRIERVKTWVLRCHACFKICKDPTKKFCPSCGNPTLLRTSVTVSAPSATDATPTLQVHLKKNFQWRNRGTIYSIPSPKPGTSKTGAGEGLILREDQSDWMRAERQAEGRRAREEKKMVNALAAGNGEGGVRLDWMDPDWMPEMLTVGAGGKGRSSGKGDMPAVGYGRKNPNERKRKKK